MLEGVYKISCNYVSCCNFTGYGYLLTDSNGVAIYGTIIGSEYNMHKICDIRDYNHITVNDANDIVVRDGPFDASRDIASCSSTNG